VNFKAFTFFDRKAVRDETSKRTRRALSRMGAFVRRTAQQSMRRRKGRSPAGTPPSKHERPWLSKLLFFSWDRSTQTVVVGPVPFGDGNAPAANEHGGAAAVRLPDGRTIRGVYDRRPFMAPALATEWPKLGACYAAAGA
jgi:ferric-dicitrate binding protein FerR (iron transport regulator)